MSDSVTIEDSKGNTFAEVIDVIGVSEVKKAFQQSVKEGSLHKWFKGSKSKDGKPGWVNVVTGGTCASDKPGEGTPKCVSASKRASMTKAERLSASRRKKKADPGQQAKSGAAKPTYVSTDKKKKMKEEYLDERLGGKGVSKKAAAGSIYPGKKGDGDFSDSDRGSGNKAKRRAGQPIKKKSPTYQAYVMNKAGISETIKRDEYGDPIGGPKISKKQLKKNLTSNTPDEQHTTTTSEGYIDLPLEVEIPNTDATFRLGLMFRESLEVDKGMLFIFEGVGKHSFHMKNTRIPLDIAFVKEDGTIESIKELTTYSSLPVYSDGQVLFAIEANRGWFTENNVEVGDEIVLGEAKDKKGKGSGSKDACYHKVKSRYSVWPSAYASGALVKCRKVGAANWGNKSESYKIDPVAHKAAQKKSKIRNLAIGNTNPNEKAAAEKKAGGPKLVGEANVDMKNYLDKKAKMLTKKRDAQSDAAKNNPHFDSTQPSPSGRNKYEEVELDEKCWKGYEKKGMKTMFGKRYPNCVKKEEFSDWRDELSYEGKDDSKKIEEGKSPAWQRKEGKSESGGLNKKGVASYRAANPGSKLKTAVTTKPSKLKKGSKAANRRKSFCSRMKGMKKKLTSAKTARDPDSRINKSLRKWNC